MKNYKLLSMCFLFGMTSFVNAQLVEKKTSKGYVKIKGRAHNAKSGAILRNNEGVFYLDGISEWDEDSIGKKVKVKGFLFLVEHTKSKGDKVVYQYIPEFYLIEEGSYKFSFGKWLK